MIYLRNCAAALARKRLRMGPGSIRTTRISVSAISCRRLSVRPSSATATLSLRRSLRTSASARRSARCSTTSSHGCRAMPASSAGRYRCGTVTSGRGPRHAPGARHRTRRTPHHPDQQQPDHVRPMDRRLDDRRTGGLRGTRRMAHQGNRGLMLVAWRYGARARAWSDDQRFHFAVDGNSG